MSYNSKMKRFNLWVTRNQIESYQLFVTSYLSTLTKKTDISICSNDDCEVTFYVPVYNSCNTIESSLRSMLSQSTSRGFCVCVYDDSSNDGTDVILQRLSIEYKNLKILRGGERVGVLLATKLARTFALENCLNSSFLSLGSDHDFWSTDYLERALDRMDQEPSADFYIPGIRRARNLGISSDSVNRSDIALLPEPISGYRDYIYDMEVGNRSLILKQCTAGTWIYGLERKGLPINNVFYFPTVGPDQFYMYYLSFFAKIIFGESPLYFNMTKNKLDRHNAVERIFHSRFLKAYQPKFEARFFTLLSHFSLLFSERKILRLKKMELVKFYFLVMSKFYSKKFGVRMKTQQILKVVRSYLRLVFGRIALFFGRYAGVWLVFFSPRKVSKNKQIRIGLFVSSPGILRLLEHVLTDFLSRESVDFYIFASKKTWNKKLDPQHLELITRWNRTTQSKVEVVFFPKFLDIDFKARVGHLKQSEDRVLLNLNFFNRADFVDDVIAKERVNRANPKNGINSNFSDSNNHLLRLELLEKIKSNKNYQSRSLKLFIQRFKLDLMMFSPIVNAPESEIFALSAPHSIKKLGVIASWDNLTVKGQLLDLYESYITWGRGQVDQLKKFHGIEGERAIVCGPYPFQHLYHAPEVSSTPEETYLWVLSSGFIANEKQLGEYAELENIAECLRYSEKFYLGFAKKIKIRLHPSSTITVINAQNFLNGVLTQGTIKPDQITKSEPVSISARKEYVDLIKSAKKLIGYATSSMVEGAILGKSAVAPPMPLAERSFKNLWHGRILTRVNGGPVVVTKSYEEFFKVLDMNDNYIPSGEFAKLIGLEENFESISQSFSNYLLSLIKGKK